MEFIIIDDTKIKVSLSKCEVSFYQIDVGTFGENSKNDSQIIKNLLNDIENTCGFSTKNYERVIINYYPSRVGGCEMFISRFTNNNNGGCSLPILFEDTSNQKGIKKSSKQYEKTFSFNSLNLVITACRELKRLNFDGKSSLYRTNDGEYYLKISYSGFFDYNFLYELSESEPNETSNLFLTENSCKICKENAIEQIGIL